MTAVDKGRVEHSTLPSFPQHRSAMRRFFLFLGNLIFAIGMGGLAIVAVVSLALVVRGSMLGALPTSASPQSSAAMLSSTTPTPTATLDTIASTAPA